MNRKELERRLVEAINMVYARDAALLEGGSEWSIAHRLALYLEGLLPGWNVDCEYSRQGSDGDQKKRASGGRVRPDIIVHHRGRTEPTHNLLAIEIKKGSPDGDFKKLMEYTSRPTGERLFQYQFGAAITLEEPYRIRWFQGGQA